MRPPVTHLRFPRPSLPSAVAALRREVRAFLDQELRAGTWQPGGKSWGEYNPELTRKIAELQAMKRSLQHLAEACHGDDRPDCPILDDLGSPGPDGDADCCH